MGAGECVDDGDVGVRPFKGERTRGRLKRLSSNEKAQEIKLKCKGSRD